MKAFILLISIFLIPAVSVTAEEEKEASQTFEELLSIDEYVLGKNMTFSKRYGKKLVFRPEKGAPRSFDYTMLHPGVLKKLNIDPEKVTEELARKAEEKLVNAEEKAIQQAAYQKAYMEAMDRRAEYMKARAYYLKQQADLRDAENEKKREAEDRRFQTATLAAIAAGNQNPTIIVQTPTPRYIYRAPYTQFPQFPQTPAPQPQKQMQSTFSRTFSSPGFQSSGVVSQFRKTSPLIRDSRD
ncbi:hypothetical protein N9B94_01320 [Verrucomicrobia bacterium]|nr:hypothetical protein [Verrucomicrobiota bacterium]